MPQADAQKRDFLPQLLYRRNDDPRILRSARSRREDDAVRMHGADFFHCHLIVPYDFDLRIKLPDHLVQVVGKTVIIIDQQYHRSTSSADFSASITAPALLMHSWYSFSGTESATIPAPL